MRFKRGVMAGAVVLAAGMIGFTGRAQADFGSFTVFGDSLSDAGTFGSRFTTNPGLVWSQVVSSNLGFTGTPAQLFTGAAFVAAGGNIWAQGGSRVALGPGNGVAIAQPVATQITTYLAGQGGTANGNGLYVLWAGANDIFYGMTNSPATVATDTVTAAGALAGLTKQLQTAGARSVVVINLPDIGSTPLFTVPAFGRTAFAANATALTQLYNGSLTTTLSTLGVNALVLDAYGMFSEIIANPGAFGLTVGNTGIACTGAGAVSSSACTPATLITPTAASTFLFADGIHPTTAGHQIIADYFMSTLRGTQFVARAADHVSQTSEGQWMISDSRQQRYLDGGLRDGEGDVYVQGQLGKADLDSKSGMPSLSGKPNTYTVGFDRNFGSGWFGGAAVSAQTDSFDVNSLGGNASGTGLAANVYGSWRGGSAYVNAAGMLSTITYNLKRNFALGVGGRSEKGNTDGTVKGLRMEAGFDFAQGATRHGAFAGVTYRQVGLGAYTELSGDASALRFGEQNFEQMRTSLGYQASVQATSSLRLSGRVAGEQELKNDARDLATGVATTTGNMITPVGGNRKPHYTRLALQADWTVSPASSLAAVFNTGSGSGIKNSAVSVNYAMRF